MCKWYYLCTYSFDPDITVVGPFDSDVECFQAAGRDASKEYNDSIENGIHCCMRSDHQTFKITLEESTLQKGLILRPHLQSRSVSLRNMATFIKL